VRRASTDSWRHKQKGMWDINLPTHAWFSRSLSTLPLLPPHLGAWVSWWGVYFSIIQLYPYKSWLMLFPLGAMTPSPRAVAKTELDGTGPGFRSHRDQTTPWCHSCKKWFIRHQVEVFSGERVRKKESSVIQMWECSFFRQIKGIIVPSHTSLLPVEGD
jgi:hypothetical protein